MRGSAEDGGVIALGESVWCREAASHLASFLAVCYVEASEREGLGYPEEHRVAPLSGSS